MQIQGQDRVPSVVCLVKAEEGNIMELVLAGELDSNIKKTF